jgi:hypothetical protein
VQVSCRTRRGSGGRRHDVVLGPDWSVTTPHDLASERIGAALGGYLSCLDLVDHTVPALEDLVQLVARRALPPLSRNHVGRWVVDQPTAGCSCQSQSFATPYEAAEHVRTPGHHARRYGADPRHLQRLLDAVVAAHGGFQMCPPPGWMALGSVREPRGIDVLWGAGVPPELVMEVQERVLPRGGPLPTAAYLGAAFRCDDLDWLRSTVAQAPDRGLDPDVVVWAAWSYGTGDRTHPHARGDWLAVGVPRSAVDVLVDGGVGLREAEELAEVTGRSLTRSALVLAAWERAGCRPGPGDIAALDVLGVGDSFEPTSGAVESLYQATRRLRVPPTRTQVAVLLGLAGNRPDALTLAKQGVVTTEQAMVALTGVVMWENEKRKVANG